MSAQTAAALRAQLESAGVDPALTALALRATAHTRHTTRVWLTQSAALQSAADGDPLGLDDRARWAKAWALVQLDLAGVGGPPGGPGAATRRMEWAQSLGTARWHAADGGAWRAAALAAAAEFERLLGGKPRLLAPEAGAWPGDLVVAVADASDPDGENPWEFGADQFGPADAEWIRAWLLRELRQSYDWGMEACVARAVAALAAASRRWPAAAEASA